jgi:hypothetical protein
MTSESLESQPVALKMASMTPLWWAAPEKPPALRTRPIVVSVLFSLIGNLSVVSCMTAFF